MRKPYIIIILLLGLTTSACGFKFFGLEMFGKTKYQVGEEVDATANVGLVNKTIGENTVNNDTLLMIILNAFLIIVIIVKEIINSVGRNSQRTMIMNIYKQQATNSQERFEKLLEAIYHSPEMVVDKVKIMEEEK